MTNTKKIENSHFESQTITWPNHFENFLETSK